MKQRWLKLAERVLALSLRERSLVILVGACLLILPGWNLLLEPAWQQWELAGKAHRDQADKILMMQAENLDRQAKLQQDPNQALHLQQASLNTQLQVLDRELAAHLVDLIPPERMVGLLEQMLRQSAKLKLVELTSIAPTPLLEGERRQSLFKHGLHLKLQGGYFDVLQYLQSLESLPEHFYWRKLNYQVGQYPMATVELELYTLSTSKDFIRG